jgi:subtilisin family serine protease
VNLLPSKLNPTGNRRLIVNMSLMVDIPANYKIVERWFPGSSGLPEGTRVRDALAPLDTSIRAAMDALSRQGVLVVAAAGNDALPTPGAARPLPRFPARLENVLSVAATQADGTAASYSNQATVPFQAGAPFGPITKNGIAVRGGEAMLHQGWSGPAPAPQRNAVPGLPGLLGPRFIDVSHNPDAMVGISSAKPLTLGRLRNPTAANPTSENTTGWVYWAGTSFAAPVISAMAAAVWELNPALPPRDTSRSGAGVADAIQGFAWQQAPDLGCGLLQVKQS